MQSIKTIKSRENHVKAITTSGTLPKIKKIALGSGGAINNIAKDLTGSETTLFNKVIEKVATVTTVNSTTARFSITINADTDNLIGVAINESGLIDENGDYYAIKTFTNKTLDSGTVINFYFDVEY